MRYFGLLSYDGTAYHGWQQQPNAVSVQSVLEERLSVKLRETIKITGAGRTDTGVHASYFVIHFDTSCTDLETTERLHDINRFLPQDIRFHEFKQVTDNAHARFDAQQRTYQYIIRTTQNPFLERFSMWHPQPLLLDAMNEAASLLLSTKDFTSFAKLHAQTETNLCDVSEAFFTPFDSGLIFQISANRFLRNMVRSIVGTLLSIGKSQLSLSEFRHIIEQKNRNAAGISVPAKGLFLTQITYPDSLFIHSPLKKPHSIFT